MDGRIVLQKVSTAVGESCLNNVNKTYGDVYKPVGDPVIVQDTYHIFNKEKQELRDEWDKALKELIDDGTIAKLQKKWNV